MPYSSISITNKNVTLDDSITISKYEHLARTTLKVIGLLETISVGGRAGLGVTEPREASSTC